MKELAQIQASVTGMETMTPDKIQKISERMVEMERANNSLGRRNTQTTNQLMTLTMPVSYTHLTLPTNREV